MVKDKVDLWKCRVPGLVRIVYITIFLSFSINVEHSHSLSAQTLNNVRTSSSNATISTENSRVRQVSDSITTVRYSTNVIGIISGASTTFVPFTTLTYSSVNVASDTKNLNNIAEILSTTHSSYVAAATPIYLPTTTAATLNNLTTTTSATPNNLKTTITKTTSNLPTTTAATPNNLTITTTITTSNLPTTAAVTPNNLTTTTSPTSNHLTTTTTVTTSNLQTTTGGTPNNLTTITTVTTNNLQTTAAATPNNLTTTTTVTTNNLQTTAAPTPNNLTTTTTITTNNFQTTAAATPNNLTITTTITTSNLPTTAAVTPNNLTTTTSPTSNHLTTTTTVTTSNLQTTTGGTPNNLTTTTTVTTNNLQTTAAATPNNLTTTTTITTNNLQTTAAVTPNNLTTTTTVTTNNLQTTAAATPNNLTTTTTVTTSNLTTPTTAIPNNLTTTTAATPKYLTTTTTVATSNLPTTTAVKPNNLTTTTSPTSNNLTTTTTVTTNNLQTTTSATPNNLTTTTTVTTSNLATRTTVTPNNLPITTAATPNNLTTTTTVTGRNLTRTKTVTTGTTTTKTNNLTTVSPTAILTTRSTPKFSATNILSSAHMISSVTTTGLVSRSYSMNFTATLSRKIFTSRKITTFEVTRMSSPVTDDVLIPSSTLSTAVFESSSSTVMTTRFNSRSVQLVTSHYSIRTSNNSTINDFVPSTIVALPPRNEMSTMVSSLTFRMVRSDSTLMASSNSTRTVPMPSISGPYTLRAIISPSSSKASISPTNDFQTTISTIVASFSVNTKKTATSPSTLEMTGVESTVFNTMSNRDFTPTLTSPFVDKTTLGASAMFRSRYSIDTTLSLSKITTMNNFTSPPFFIMSKFSTKANTSFTTTGIGSMISSYPTMGSLTKTIAKSSAATIAETSSMMESSYPKLTATLTDSISEVYSTSLMTAVRSTTYMDTITPTVALPGKTNRAPVPSTNPFIMSPSLSYDYLSTTIEGHNITTTKLASSLNVTEILTDYPPKTTSTSKVTVIRLSSFTEKPTTINASHSRSEPSAKTSRYPYITLTPTSSYQATMVSQHSTISSRHLTYSLSTSNTSNLGEVMSSSFLNVTKSSTEYIPASSSKPLITGSGSSSFILISTRNMTRNGSATKTTVISPNSLITVSPKNYYQSPISSQHSTVLSHDQENPSTTRNLFTSTMKAFNKSLTTSNLVKENKSTFPTSIKTSNYYLSKTPVTTPTARVRSSNHTETVAVTVSATTRTHNVSKPATKTIVIPSYRTLFSSSTVDMASGSYPLPTSMPASTFRNPNVTFYMSSVTNNFSQAGTARGMVKSITSSGAQALTKINSVISSTTIALSTNSRLKASDYKSTSSRIAPTSYRATPSRSLLQVNTEAPKSMISTFTLKETPVQESSSPSLALSTTRRLNVSDYKSISSQFATTSYSDTPSTSSILVNTEVPKSTILTFTLKETPVRSSSSSPLALSTTSRLNSSYYKSVSSHATTSYRATPSTSSIQVNTEMPKSMMSTFTLKETPVQNNSSSTLALSTTSRLNSSDYKSISSRFSTTSNSDFASTSSIRVNTEVPKSMISTFTLKETPVKNSSSSPLALSTASRLNSSDYKSISSHATTSYRATPSTSSIQVNTEMPKSMISTFTLKETPVQNSSSPSLALSTTSRLDVSDYKSISSQFATTSYSDTPSTSSILVNTEVPKSTISTFTLKKTPVQNSSSSSIALSTTSRLDSSDYKSISSRLSTTSYSDITSTSSIRVNTEMPKSMISTFTLKKTPVENSSSPASIYLSTVLVAVSNVVTQTASSHKITANLSGALFSQIKSSMVFPSTTDTALSTDTLSVRFTQTFTPILSFTSVPTAVTSREISSPWISSSSRSQSSNPSSKVRLSSMDQTSDQSLIQLPSSTPLVETSMSSSLSSEVYSMLLNREYMTSEYLTKSVTSISQTVSSPELTVTSEKGSVLSMKSSMTLVTATISVQSQMDSTSSSSRAHITSSLASVTSKDDAKSIFSKKSSIQNTRITQSSLSTLSRSSIYSYKQLSSSVLLEVTSTKATRKVSSTPSIRASTSFLSSREKITTKATRLSDVSSLSNTAVQTRYLESASDIPSCITCFPTQQTSKAYITSSSSVVTRSIAVEFKIQVILLIPINVIVNDKDFIQNLQKKLEDLYNFGLTLLTSSRKRRALGEGILPVNKLGKFSRLRDLFKEDLNSQMKADNRRFRRQTTNITRVEIVNVTRRAGSEDVRVTFYVTSGNSLVPAKDAAKTLNAPSTADKVAKLGYLVSGKFSEAANPVETEEKKKDDETLLIVLAVCIPVAFVFAACLIIKCNKKQRRSRKLKLNKVSFEQATSNGKINAPESSIEERYTHAPTLPMKDYPDVIVQTPARKKQRTKKAKTTKRLKTEDEMDGQSGLAGAFENITRISFEGPSNVAIDDIPLRLRPAVRQDTDVKKPASKDIVEDSGVPRSWIESKNKVDMMSRKSEREMDKKVTADATYNDEEKEMEQSEDTMQIKANIEKWRNKMRQRERRKGRKREKKRTGESKLIALEEKKLSRREWLMAQPEIQAILDGEDLATSTSSLRKKKYRRERSHQSKKHPYSDSDSEASATPVRRHHRRRFAQRSTRRVHPSENDGVRLIAVRPRKPLVYAFEEPGFEQEFQQRYMPPEDSSVPLQAPTEPDEERQF
ncbi:mucin-3A-like, partial [Dendronephthya gigantea]|uniref:mucin-3A-like n=1 Tax=Dendronephthya gigantea TaxID=151771 RepID=UPI00106C73EF